MNIQQIRYFLAIVDCGSFSKAAARVYVTQPTLSAGIKALEEEFGAALFLRDNRRVVLTEAGEKVLPHARAAYQALEAARKALLVSDQASSLRLGMLNTAPIEPIARLIRDYRELYPMVTVELTEGTDPWLREQLKAGAIDALITVLRPGDRSSSSEVLFDERVMLATWIGHPLAKHKHARLADLHQQPFIDRGGCELWADLQAAMAHQGVSPRVVYRATSDEVVMELVAGGLGVSVLPRRLRTHEGVAFLPIEDYAVTRKIGLKWRARDRSPGIARFRCFAHSHQWQVA